jgi:hypothetical protein
MEHVRDTFSVLTRDYLAPALAGIGLRGAGRDWTLPHETHWLLLGLRDGAFNDSFVGAA